MTPNCKNCEKPKRNHTTVVVGDSNYPEGITVQSARWELRCSVYDKDLEGKNFELEDEISVKRRSG